MDGVTLPAGPLEALLQLLEGPGDHEATAGQLLERAEAVVLAETDWLAETPEADVTPAPWEALLTALDERYEGPALLRFDALWDRVRAVPRNLDLLNAAYERYHEGGH